MGVRGEIRGECLVLLTRGHGRVQEVPDLLPALHAALQRVLVVVAGVLVHALLGIPALLAAESQ